jgi:hypothetical protein
VATEQLISRWRRHLEAAGVTNDQAVPFLDESAAAFRDVEVPKPPTAMQSTALVHDG